MKLELPKEWFEKNLPHDDLEAGACNPAHISVEEREREDSDSRKKDEFVEAHD